MNDPRCFKESGGDCFLGAARAIALSLVLHVLVLVGMDFSQPLPPEGRGKLNAVIGQPKHSAQPAVDTVQPVPTPGGALLQPTEMAGGRSVRHAVTKNGQSELDRGVQALPPGEDLSAYRLALGRAFGNLLDEELRSSLPPGGELLFRIHYQAGQGGASLRPTAVLDPDISARLLDAMNRAVAMIPFPSAWQSGNYQLELRAQLVGA